MKKIWIGIAVLIAVGLVWAPMSGAQQPVKLKMTSFLPPPRVSMLAEIAQIWQAEVTKRTNGNITFENYWGGAMATPAEHIELVKKGTVQLAQTHQWYTPGKFPIGHFEYVFPFGPMDYELVAKAMRQMRSEFPEFVRDESKENVIVLSTPPGGVYTLLAKKPIKTVDGFKGEKVALIGRFFGKWLPPGAQAVVRPGGERYDLLQGGVTTVNIDPFDLMYAFKLAEQAKNHLAIYLTTACWAHTMMNLDTFKSFSPEYQKILTETGKEIELQASREIVPKWWDRVQREWKSQGVAKVDFPDAEISKWAATLEDIPAQFAAEIEGKGYPGYKMMQRWQEITADLGFKWARKWGVKK
jgi:TRAP-type C4-dicarboxylate transport system substrate-binding protein